MLKKPEHAIVYLRKNSHPAIEKFRQNLVIIVETAEHKTVLGQPTFRAAKITRSDLLLSIIRLITIWQIDHLFRIVRFISFRNYLPIGNDIIHIAGAQRPRKPEIVHLNRGRSLRKHLCSVLAEIAIQIDQNVDLIVANGSDCRCIVKLADVDNSVDRGIDAFPNLAAIVRSVINAVDLKSRIIVEFQSTNNEMRCSLLTQLARRITDTYLLVTG